MSVRTRTWSQPEPGPLSEPVLTDIVRRVVEVAKPQRIVMFGSAIRGTARGIPTFADSKNLVTL
jgi:hypothetical protein